MLIGHGTSHGDAESAGPNTELIADSHVRYRVVGRLAYGSVGQAFETEARAGVGDAVEQHA